MAGRGAPTYLKRQKEQQRAARASAKRAERQARRERRAAEGEAETPEDEIPAVPSDQEPPPEDASTD